MADFPDVAFKGQNLQTLMTRYSRDGELDLVTPEGNRVIFNGQGSDSAMRSVRILFSGRNSTIRIGKVHGVARLDIACSSGGNVTMAECVNIRGATVFASEGCSISIGADCLMSRDVMIYGTGAHGVHNLSDGARRGKTTIEIGEHVWIGQGVRILAGAKVGNGSVIGSYSVLAGTIPDNAAAAGNPCRVTTRGIFWVPRRVPGNYFEYLERRGKPRPSFTMTVVDTGPVS